MTHRLTPPQAAHLRMMIFALLIGGSGKLRTLARITRDPHRHRTSPSRFLATSGWPEADLLQRAASKLLRAMRPRRGEVLSLLIDATIIAKKARTMDAVRKTSDSAAKRFCTGHTLLVVAVRFRGVTIPWQIELWLPRDFDAEQAREFRNLRRRNKPDRRIGDLGSGMPEASVAADTAMSYEGRWRWMHIAALDGSLKKIGQVRIVFSKRINDPCGHQLALATDETNLDARAIVGIYESRWGIEVLLKELKSHLERGASQRPSWWGITRYLHTVCLAHITLTDPR